ncbi:negative transcriptional regulator, PaiB family [Methylobacterium phyllostachyos]|uniref:Negative transcriptional regulator, PaiB family n=1 Tax=Methylobacterium phyllostachyos TaxID=582672 RepID=A0A1G9T8M3_9HYPH|nr:FMN-binding negative transcriptional regulator [Methylobacterium phyllostachyos]SDM44031.1 negative transcriptional regulator, PaiB family [Methylobacterium phyllostachyos]
MYQPPHFREESRDAQHALIRAHPLGLLVTAGPGGLIANPIPFLLDVNGGYGMLRAHLARANPQAQDLAVVGEGLVVFQGPEGYVSPSWYASKREHGRVVPTWNYAIVQVRGRPRVIEDPAWLRRQIADLTALREAPRAEPWAVSDAPESFVAAQVQALIGVEIAITHLEGKWKMSQNRSAADRTGVIAGLQAAGEADLAKLVAERSGS